MGRSHSYHRAAASPSNAIWASFPTEKVAAGDARGFHYFEDFIHDVATVNLLSGWTVLGENPGITLTPTAQHGGVVEIQVGATADNEHSFMMGRSAFMDLSSTEWFGMEMRFKIDDFNTSGVFIGVSDTDTGIFAAAGGTVALSHRIGWTSAEDAATFSADIDNDTTVTTPTLSATPTLEASTYIKLGLTYDRNTGAAMFWYDDEEEFASVTTNPHGAAKVVASSTTGLPTGLLRPAFGIQAPATGEPIMTIDWIRCGALFSDG